VRGCEWHERQSWQGTDPKTPIPSQMIIQKARKVRTADSASFAWAGLRKLQNVELVTQTLIRIHKIPKRYHDDARKQARQLRYCLIQAREYFSAAKAVTTATKPNLLYYGTMSLALAEILFKQSGHSSLDKAREQNRHHGLTMSAGSIPRNADLQTSARMLRAKPHEINGTRWGTFDLWHRTSREHPLCGTVTTHAPDGTATMGFNVIMGAINTEYAKISKTGLTFADCLASLPSMYEQLSETNIKSTLVRGKTTAIIHGGEQWSSSIDVIFHPSSSYAKLKDLIRANPNGVDRINFQDGSNAGVIHLSADWINGNPSVPLPPAATVNTEEWRMWTNKPPLNEFGYFYVSLYLAGNYARYFPDKWLLDVETSTALALSIEELCATAEWRVPWLALSELDQTLYVLET
jgi:YaaC-like Protein